ncbi:M50 family metallopeptidase [Rhodalgimonas zhirmunskyi]|uniref:M50 family metallopeptidase n=1 Tax=Rhodalgimonas zhirmunskyi TaxID=2964767 RepID=A0AAJ1U8V4_9RHOB|nr:M50 family metallopeptidase [Rhodoalgimonas zhirmunskyi]MDQ2093930.1 M50 family metallopeptidase [Rhodoalgimonas zhirmunskyi]
MPEQTLSTRAKRLWPALALLAGVVALWQTPILLPLKILTVFFHEFSHLAAVLLTGGSPESLSLTPHQGGAVLSRGGNRFLVLSAGYLGSLLIGIALFRAARASKADRWIMGALGAVLLAVAALYVREVFALAFCAGTGAAMLAAARFLPHGPNDVALQVIGLTSMVYVPLDIFSDTISRAHLNSDARMLSTEFGLPTAVWGALWLALSLAAIAYALRATLRD